jgi:cytochrome c551/c552
MHFSHDIESKAIDQLHEKNKSLMGHQMKIRDGLLTLIAIHPLRVILLCGLLAVTGCCNAAIIIAGGNDGTEIERSRNIDLQTLSLGVDTVRRGANHLEQPSPAQGMELFQKKGCVACHATDSKTEGKIGPPMKDLVGSVRHFVDGSTAIADEVYIRQSIVAPGEKVVKGFQPVMPSFLKILAENEVESIILYVKSL